MNNERTQGATVYPLPPKLQRDQLQLAVGKAPDGAVYLISTEGVGWLVDPVEGVLLDNGLRYDAQDLEILAEEENRPRDLSTWIRTFGARLESNWYTWFRRLTGEEV